VFGLWWATWIIGSLISQLSWRLLRNEPDDIDMLIDASWADIGSNLGLAVAATAAIFVITAVQGRVASGLARTRRR
jgi:hypothetical protein